MFRKFFYGRTKKSHSNGRAPLHIQKYTLNSNTYSQLSQGQQFNERLGRWAQGRKNEK